MEPATEIAEAEEGGMLVIVVVVICVLLVIGAVVLKFVILAKPAKKRDAILLTGPSGAGKTQLFSQLCHGYTPLHGTVSSMKENTGVLKVKAAGAAETKEFPIVDVPGMQRFRAKLLEEYGERGKAIIFMIDSVEFPKQMKDVAEYLYELLATPALLGQPVLILCNKQDFAFRAKKAGPIEALIEKEFNLIRTTRSATLSSTSMEDDGGSSVVLGEAGVDFKFAQIEAKVEFMEFTAKVPKGGDAELGAIEAWLSSSLK